ncbi:MAG: GntR family transcriptional regulator [Planctomycetaceae bacterium]|nr:GntR family transcriptional regulator [Planctomycetaceae bacterium]
MTITDYIRSDLARRIRIGKNIPEKLTLAALADEYEVSLTPVREAIGLLHEDGLVLKGENRRLIVNPQRVGESTEEELGAPPKPIDWENVLTQHVLYESLRGSQEFLREEVLTERYGVGRTILRQVFSHLAGSGFLIHEPRRGWRVRELTDDDLRDYIDIRETLELKALQLALPHLQQSRLQVILDGNQPDERNRPQIDNNLHRYFIGLADNRYITEFFQRYGAFYQPLFDYAALGGDVLGEMASHHREILESLIKGEEQPAREALSRHIRAQYSAVLKVIDKLDLRNNDGEPIETHISGLPGEKDKVTEA